MNILIVSNNIIPVVKYGGIERVIWYLGKELVSRGHRVTYLVPPGSHCPFAEVIFYNKAENLSGQIPDDIDFVHFQFQPAEPIQKPYVITIHGNLDHQEELDANTIFISGQHAARCGSSCFVYNGLDWNDYGRPQLNNKRNYFHFLGEAAWRLKNVQGAINVIRKTPSEKLKVLGGTRLNFRMGFRLTLSPRISFEGKVGGEKKLSLLNGSKGLIFPVKWHEPFGLAIVESLYMGCPVFGTPYGSLPEIVNNEVGFLSNKSSELAKAIMEVQQFSKQRCHDYAAQRFSASAMTDAYLEKYEQVLNGKPLNNKKPALLEKQPDKFLAWE